MLFSLEVIQAKHGDCLILHYGTKRKPKFILIDGGPSGVYRKHLKPRLLSIKDKWNPDDSLPLSMVMVSHMDDDHVNGILKLTNDISTSVEDQETPDFEIVNLWANSFDDIIGNIKVPQISAIKAGARVANLSQKIPFLDKFDHHKTAIIASTGQGRKLRKVAKKLSIAVNNDEELIYSSPNETSIKWSRNMSITVIHPNAKRLTEMQKKWDKDLKKAKKAGDDSIILASLASKDSSPFNLASIVCLIESDDKTILLTGDSRDDDILEGLKEHDLLDDNGKIHVDILKIPHHGSDRNVSRSFFTTVTADHYVISGDGRHHNPEKASLIMLEEATKDVHDDFTIHFTNREGKDGLKEKIDEFIDGKERRGRNFKTNFIDSQNPTIIIDLLDKVKY